jgi:integrase
VTLDAFADRYLAEHAEPKKKPSSVVADRLNLKVHIRPALGKKRITAVTRADVAKFIHDMRATPVAANRCFALLSKMMSLAEAWGVRPDGSNPCRHVEKFPESKRERFLSIAELGKLGAALEAAQARGRSAVYLAALVRLLIFTGARLGEIRTARWDWIDQETGDLRLPDSKTGAKVVHLPAPALAVLAQLPRVEGNPHVIAGAGKAPIAETFGFWAGVREAAGLADVRLHDLRHSFASVGASSGLGLPIIGKLLGHAHASTTQRYSHIASDPAKAAANQIGSVIDAAMSGREPAAVVPLRGRGKI